MGTPWANALGEWFQHQTHARRLEKVLGYGGCRELWLQAELAMWLEERKLLDPNGDWDTNVSLPGYGKCDLATRRDGGGFGSALEVKVLGSTYQPKVLRGAGSLGAFLDDLRARRPAWQLRNEEIDRASGFNLVADVKRLRDVDASEKILLLVAVNRQGEESLLGEALANIEFPAAERHNIDVTAGIRVRMWRM